MPVDKHLGVGGQEPTEDEIEQRRVSIVDTPKSFGERLMPVFACGAGLFSDGYLNNVIGSVSTCLGRIYGKRYKTSPAVSNIGSITFVGTVVGQLAFGYTTDKWSRKWSLFVSTVILFIFAILATGAYGAGGSLGGLLAALTAYRFFLGIGIGGEYPAGSVSCSESTGELKSGTRNRWFCLFTNCMIDFGFVVGAIVPAIMVSITGENHLRLAWRLMLGFGVLPPLMMLYFRWKLDEPESFKRNGMSKTKTPYMLAIKFYWFRLCIVGLIWFIYDFSSYSFGFLSSQILTNLLGNDYPLWKSFSWNILLNFFYMPGCILGAWTSDWWGPRNALGYVVIVQAIVGFIFAGVMKYLIQPSNVAGFIVVYGIFTALGEMGPGNNIGLIASKTSATAIRGQYYGIAAAIGKIGAFVGSKTLILLYDHYENMALTNTDSDAVKAIQYPFFISSALCIVSGLCALFLLPHIGQDTIEEEDAKFKVYLEENGYDTSKMGIHSDSMENILEKGDSSTSQRESAPPTEIDMQHNQKY